jgi:two-component system OmpR family sensor kinase
MTFKSIKWRLQIYYGLILVAVLATLGFSAYALDRNRQLHRIDDELQRRGPRPGPEGPDFDRPPPQDFREGPPEDAEGPPQFHLPSQAAGLFETNDPNQFYFILEARDGHTIAKSGVVVAAAERRERRRQLRPGDSVVVGCSIAPELKDLRITALELTGVGAVILFFGLAGGGWLVSRALRPIDSISNAALKISAGDLSQRISAAETESELGRLATVLNSTFARLESAFAQQKQFTSDAAHELRTPVTVILTQTQTALTCERSAAEYRETVEACQRAAQRMRKLIGTLLELARFDAGQEPMNRAKFDLCQTAHECVELIRPLAIQRNIKIERRLSATECTGDSERLAQVITNLLANAVEYNRDGGEIRITVQPQNGAAVLTITDTGIGIAVADLPHLFERFYRADKSRSAGHNGLGLAISKAIVEAHGGTIEATSEENAGTIFTVRLP